MERSLPHGAARASSAGSLGGLTEVTQEEGLTARENPGRLLAVVAFHLGLDR